MALPVAKAAIISPEDPFPLTSGGSLRIFQHVSVLRRLGFEVALFPAHLDPNQASRQGSSTRRRRTARHLRLAWAGLTGQHPLLLGMRPAMAAFLSWLGALEPDLVVLEYSQLAALLPTVRQAVPEAKVVVDAHNVETDLLRQLIAISPGPLSRVRHWIEWKATRRLEVMGREADEVWATSLIDAQTLRARGLGVVRVVPNAVDTEAYSYEQGPGERILLFIGTFSHIPNILAADLLCSQIFPRIRSALPETVLYLVGKDAEAIHRWATSDVIVTGSVPDVRPFLRRAGAVVIPLRWGGGTRLKVLEALAMGRAVVSTHKGCEGLAVEDGVHALIADDPTLFADRVIDLLHDPGRRRQLGDQGRRLVETQYSWDAMEATLKQDTLVGKLMEGGRRH